MEWPEYLLLEECIGGLVERYFKRQLEITVERYGVCYGFDVVVIIGSF